MIDPWFAILVVLGLLSASMALLSAAARKHGMAPELVRKLLHVEMALVTLSFPWLFTSAWPVVVLACAAVLWFRLLQTSAWLEKRFGYALRAGGRDSKGEVWFACGVCLAYLWSAAEPLAYCIAILVLAFADTAAALVGQRYGQARLLPGGARKSAVGSLAFFVTALLIAAGALVAGAGLRPGESLVSAALLAAVTTGVEASLGDGLDNLFVPIAALVALEFAAL